MADPKGQTKTVVLRVKSDPGADKEFKKVLNGLDQIGKKVKNLNRIGTGFAGIFAFDFIQNQLRSFADAADSITLIQGRLKVLEGSNEAAAETFDMLRESAARVKAPVGNLATLYARLRLSTGELGVTTEQALLGTEALANSFRLSGSTAQEALSSAIQLTQGFSAGAVRGQELRSVLESNAVLSGELAKAFGISRGALLKFGESGKLTADQVFNVLIRQSGKLQNDANKLGDTFGNTLVRAFDLFSIQLNRLDQSLGLASKLARSFEFLERNIDRFLVVAGAGLLAFFANKLPAAIAVAQASLIKFIGILVRFLIANPYTAAFLAIVTAITIASAYIENFGRKVASVISSVIGFINSLIKKLSELIQAASEKEGVLSFLNFIDKGVVKGLNFVSGKLDEAQSKLDKYVNSPLDPKKKKGDGDKTIDIQKQLVGLELLNYEYKQGRLTLEEYNNQLNLLNLEEVNKGFDEGKKNVFDFNEALRTFKEQKLNEEFNKNAISAEKFNESIFQLRLDELNDKLKQNKISLLDFRKEVDELERKFKPGNPFQEGVKSYLKEIVPLSQALSESYKQVFQDLETAIFDSLRGGQDAFQKFGQNVLDILTKIFIRYAIVQELARGFDQNPGISQGIGGFFSSFFGGGPTPEAGPAATRGATQVPINGIGKLTSASIPVGSSQSLIPTGSNVVVNINNNSNAEIQQKESVGPDGQKIVDILVVNKIKEGFAKGMFDRELNASYGLKRRGV